MKGFLDGLIRFRVIILAAIVLVTGFLGYEATRIQLNTDFSTYLAADDPLVEDFNRVGEVFGTNYVGMVLINTDVFTPEWLDSIKTLTQRYEKVDGVVGVTSLYSLSQMALDGRRLLPPYPEAPSQIEPFKEAVMRQAFLKGLVVSDSGSAALILVNFDPNADHSQVAKALEDITNSVVPNPDLVYFGGMPFLMYAFQSTIIGNLAYLIPIVVLLLVGILYIGFRNVHGVIMPLLVVGVATIWIVGFMALLGIPMDLLTGITPIILLAMGSADGIHLMRRFFELRAEGKSPVEAARAGVSEMAGPIALTTLTTMVGFASLATTNFAVIRTFGLVTAAAIFLALVVTILLLPILMSWITSTSPAVRRDRTKRGWPASVATVVFRRPGWILGATLLLTVVAVAGIPKIQRNVDWTLCLDRNSKAYQANVLLREAFGGSLPVQVVVQGNLKDPAVLSIVRGVEKMMNALPLVSGSVSVASLVEEFSASLTGRYGLPQDPKLVDMAWKVLEDFPGLRHMVTADGKEALIQGKMATMATADMAESVTQINEHLKNVSGRYVVVDLETLPPEARDRAISIRARELANRIVWDLEARGLKADVAVVEPVVRAVLTDTPPPLEAGARARVIREALAKLGDGVNLPPAAVDGLVQAVLASIDETGRVQRDRLASILASAMPMPGLDDMLDPMVAFVNQVLRDVRFEGRVRWALDRLAAQLPGLQDDSDLRQRVEEDLFAATWTVVPLPEGALSGIQPLRVVDVEFRQTGLVPVLKKMEDELVPTQVLSVVIALGVIFLLFALVFRSLIIGLVGVVPTVLTILVNFAALGYLGIGLDSYTAMIASVAIGLGVDYAIHFVARYRKELGRGLDNLTALKETMSTTGISIMINALSVAGGFVVLVFAVGQHLQRFGGLLALALVTSAIFTLLVLPALLLVLRPRALYGVEKKNRR